jgi:hypothetical protein
VSFRRLFFAAQNSVVARLGSAAAFIAAYTWWLYNRGAGDRIVAMIGAAVAFLTTSIFTTSSKVSEHDTELFNKFNDHYPFNSWVSFLKIHCFSQPFPHSRLDKIDSIMNQWAPDPMMHFKDKAFESRFAALLSALDEFRNELSLDIHQMGGDFDDPWYGISKPDPWTEQGQRAYEQAYKRINELANHVVHTYQAWIEAAKFDILA